MKHAWCSRPPSAAVCGARTASARCSTLICGRAHAAALRAAASTVRRRAAVVNDASGARAAGGRWRPAARAGGCAAPAGVQQQPLRPPPSPSLSAAALPWSIDGARSSHARASAQSTSAGSASSSSSSSSSASSPQSSTHAAWLVSTAVRSCTSSLDSHSRSAAGSVPSSCGGGGQRAAVAACDARERAPLPPRRCSCARARRRTRRGAPAQAGATRRACHHTPQADPKIARGSSAPSTDHRCTRSHEPLSHAACTRLQHAHCGFSAVV